MEKETNYVAAETYIKKLALLQRIVHIIKEKNVILKTYNVYTLWGRAISNANMKLPKHVLVSWSERKKYSILIAFYYSLKCFERCGYHPPFFFLLTASSAVVSIIYTLGFTFLSETCYSKQLWTQLTTWKKNKGIM